MKLLFSLGAAAALLGGAGCQTDFSGSGGGDTAPRGPFAEPCDDTMDDIYAVETIDGSVTAGAIVEGSTCSGVGDCLKCAVDTLYDVKDVVSALHDDGYTGPAASHNLQTYRFVYGTTRLDHGVVKKGASSALYFVPAMSSLTDTLVVVAYDTAGFGPECAPSLEDPRSTSNGDAHAMALAAAAHGYLTLVIDFAGMGLGDVPPGWGLAEDEAHSLLDATRAVRTLFPKKMGPSHTVLMGLGEGGHAVLSAQAIAASYGLAGHLDGVVAFAPIWIAPRNWGASLAGAGGLNDEDKTQQLAFDLLYFYGHGELYDGPGGGVAMLRDEKRSAASELITSRCFNDLVGSIDMLGTVASDVFDPTFVHEVSSCAIAGSGASCHQGAAETWNPRFTDDRPAVDPKGAPIVVWQGGADTLVPPDRAICGKDRLDRDVKSKPSTLTYCGDEQASHGSVVERDLGWVLSWIDHATGHGAAPKACPAFAPKDGNGKPVTCAEPPPNSD